MRNCQLFKKNGALRGDGYMVCSLVGWLVSWLFALCSGPQFWHNIHRLKLAVSSVSQTPSQGAFQ